MAITVIAAFYTDELAPLPLVLAVVPLALFGLAVQRGYNRWWVLLPLAVATWALVHASGVHATVAGVLLGFVVPVSAVAGANSQPSPSSTGCGPFRPVWRCPCSRSSPRG